MAVGPQSSTISQFTATASNPSGGTAPTITLKPVGCSVDLHDVGSTHVLDGTTVTIASGMVFDVNRPASTQTTQAHVTVKATISGGGSEEINRTIPAQLNTGPSLNVTPTPGSSSYSIAWSGTGTITVSIDGASYGTPGSSPITVTRDSSDHTYAFKAVADGQTIQTTVTIPALASSSALTGAFSSLTNTLHDTATDTIDFGWAWSGGSVTFEVYVRDVGRFGDTLYHYYTTTGAGATTYRYTAGEDITTAISPTVVIGFSLRALSGSTYGPTSVTTETTYGTV